MTTRDYKMVPVSNDVHTKVKQRLLDKDCKHKTIQELTEAGILKELKA